MEHLSLQSNGAWRAFVSGTGWGLGLHLYLGSHSVLLHNHLVLSCTRISVCCNDLSPPIRALWLFCDSAFGWSCTGSWVLTPTLQLTCWVILGHRIPSLLPFSLSKTGHQRWPSVARHRAFLLKRGARAGYHSADTTPVPLCMGTSPLLESSLQVCTGIRLRLVALGRRICRAGAAARLWDGLTICAAFLDFVLWLSSLPSRGRDCSIQRWML